MPTPQKNNAFRVILFLALTALACTCAPISGLLATATPAPTPTPLPTNTPVPTPTPEVIDISGRYSIDGVNQDGSTYGGQATITHTGGNAYAITWAIGEQEIPGTGVLEGNIFTANDGVIFLTYTVLPDGTLDGTWIEQNVEGGGTEVLTYIGP